MPTTYMFGQQFPTPLPMQKVLQSVIVLPTVSFSPNNGTVLSAQINTSVLVTMIGDWKAGLTAPHLVLYTNNLVPSKTTQFTDLVEPIGPWYSEKACTLGAAYIAADGTIALTGGSEEWDYSGTDSEMIVGWALVDITA